MLAGGLVLSRARSDSGSGKSMLLRTLREDLGTEASDHDGVEIDPAKALVNTVGRGFTEALSLLANLNQPEL